MAEDTIEPSENSTDITLNNPFAKEKLTDEVIRKSKGLGIGAVAGKGLALAEKKALYGEGTRWIQIQRELYGRRIANGATSEVLWDEGNLVTKLFEPNLTDAQIAANARQVAMYRDNKGEHPFLAFVREIPGGWQQEYFPNDGNLRDFLSSERKITEEMVEQAIKDYEQLVQITGSAHGDLVKRPEFLGDWQKELLRKQLEAVENTGYINHEQVLVGKPDESGARRLIFIDWGGGGDPFPVNGTQDPTNEEFKRGELEGLKKGLQTILDRQPVGQPALVVS